MKLRHHKEKMNRFGYIIIKMFLYEKPSAHNEKPIKMSVHVYQYIHSSQKYYWVLTQPWRHSSEQNAQNLVYSRHCLLMREGANKICSTESSLLRGVKFYG